jgi:hypothetical protein
MTQRRAASMPLPCIRTLVFGLGLLMIEGGFGNRLRAHEDAEERNAPVPRSLAVRYFDEATFGGRGSPSKRNGAWRC